MAQRPLEAYHQRRFQGFRLGERRMNRLSILALFFAGLIAPVNNTPAAQTGSRPAIEWEKSDEGETAFVPMKSAPYPHPSRDKGYTYNKTTFPRDPHYSDSTVGLFIPRGYRRTPKANVVVYLHGWSNNVRKAISEFKL